MAGEEDVIAEVIDKYTFDGPVLDLGALVAGGAAHPQAQVRIPLGMLTRHGLVAGATGTGKTKTLQLMAEQLSAQGVPVFLADVKGDLSGIAMPGRGGDKVTGRAEQIGQQWSAAACPVEFYRLGEEGTGVPLRATVTSFGPTLLAKVLGLNDVQEASLGLIFHFADQHGLQLLDLTDLRAVVQYLAGDEGSAELAALGGLSKQTAGVILRSLVTLSDQGGDTFFGEPEFDTADLLRVGDDGVGVVSVVELAAVQDHPALFSTFLMWLLADLYHDLPEVGDVDKPKLVFFFDEAHLLFDGASKAFRTAITQTVRLIRSKGIGVVFVTQTPKDVPGDVLAQLGNRVQHALRAYTPDDAKALKATVSTFPRSSYDLEELLTGLGIGEAVVTVLSETGAPTPVAWTRLRAPRSLMAAADAAVLAEVVRRSPQQAKYGTAIDRESAREVLAERSAAAERERSAADGGSKAQDRSDAQDRAGEHRPDPDKDEEESTVHKIFGSSAFRSLSRSLGSTVGRQITRSLFGTARRR